MPSVAIEITRFVDEYQPGMIECALVDALGNTHKFVEKAPIVSDKDLWSTSAYPCHGEINCEIEEEWHDDEGRSLVRINADQAWHVESTNGDKKFIVLLSQMVQTWIRRLTLAKTYIGKCILTGVTHLDHDDKFIEQVQMHGVIEAVSSKGMQISLRGKRSGEAWLMPPNTEAISMASPGTYTLRSAGEAVEHPDLLATWTITKPLAL